MSNIVRIGKKNGSIKVNNIYDAQNNIVESQEDYFKRQLEEARKQGFENGKMAAFNELEKEFVKRLNIKSQQFEEYISAINSQLTEYEQSLEKIILELAFVYAERIIHREIERESNIIENINNAAKKLAGAVKVTIRLNPEDYEFIKSTNQEILADESFSKILFDKDDKIEKGGCLIESEIGNVDARIISQFNELKQKVSTSLINNSK
jgi:flagellar assembly protein FliH